MKRTLFVLTLLLTWTLAQADPPKLLYRLFASGDAGVTVPVSKIPANTNVSVDAGIPNYRSQP